MSQSKHSTIIPVIIALIVASAIFAVITSTAPPYVSGKQIENGLVAQLRFGKTAYQTFETIEAEYIYTNPQNTPITFTPPEIQNITFGYINGITDQTIHGGSMGPITLEPGESYSTHLSITMPLIAGIYYVDVNGTSGTVDVYGGPLQASVRTDKQVYAAGGGGGTATLEIANTGVEPLSYVNFSPLELRYWYVGEAPGDVRSLVFVSWVYPTTTVQPGEIHAVMSFSFPTPKPGSLILDFNGVVKTVTVLP
jgi:hypothetical protein